MAITNFAEARDLDWTGKRAIKYVDTMCLALGLKPDNIKNSPSSKCRNKFSAIAFEYEKQYNKGNSEMHSGDYLEIDLKKIKKKKTSKNTKIDAIQRAKQACINLGFTAGTEKFADCSLKLIKMKSE